MLSLANSIDEETKKMFMELTLDKVLKPQNNLSLETFLLSRYIAPTLHANFDTYDKIST